MNPQQLDLTGKDLAVSANAGDDIVLPFTAIGIDTTSWTLECILYKANTTLTGPDGPTIGSATVVNTPGSPDSSIVVTVGSAITSLFQNVPIFGSLKKTNAGSARTLSDITISLE